MHPFREFGPLFNIQLKRAKCEIMIPLLLSCKKTLPRFRGSCSCTIVRRWRVQRPLLLSASSRIQFIGRRNALLVFGRCTELLRWAAAAEREYDWWGYQFSGPLAEQYGRAVSPHHSPLASPARLVSLSYPAKGKRCNINFAEISIAHAYIHDISS
jgi:hypothetical protein